MTRYLSFTIILILTMMLLLGCRDEVIPTCASSNTKTIDYQQQNHFVEGSLLTGALWEESTGNSDDIEFIKFSNDSIYVYQVDIDTASNYIDIDSFAIYYRIAKNKIVLQEGTQEHAIDFTIANNILTLIFTSIDCSYDENCQEQVNETFYRRTKYRSIEEMLLEFDSEDISIAAPEIPEVP